MISEQTLRLIHSAKNIAIAIADEASGDQIGAALGLLNFFIMAGKKAEFLFSGELPSQFSFLASYFPEDPAPSEEGAGLRDFIISLDAKKHGIAEIRYEKNGDALSIILGAKQNISLADILVTSPDSYDLIVSLGIHKREMILAKAEADAPRTARLRRDFGGQARTPLLLLSRDSARENDADAIFTDTEKSSWCELGWDIITTANDKKEITETIATPLCAGLFAATENLQSPNTTVASARLASLLVQHGAKQELIRQHSEVKTPLNLMQLWGRALSRSRLDPETNILWSFIPAEDFLKTGSTSKDLALLFTQMERAISSPKGFLYVFENPHKNHIRAILKSNNNAFLADTAKKEAGDLSPSTLNFHKSFSSFTEAEEYLRALLTKVVQ